MCTIGCIKAIFPNTNRAATVKDIDLRFLAKLEFRKIGSC